jgi:hypothetical protein
MKQILFVLLLFVAATLASCKGCNDAPASTLPVEQTVTDSVGTSGTSATTAVEVVVDTTAVPEKGKGKENKK